MNKTIKHLTIACIAFLILPLFAGCDSNDTSTGASTSVTVMTRNVYLGGDLFSLLDPACEGDAILGCVAQLYATVSGSQIQDRMAAIALEIQTENPDIVGLQEISTYYTQSPGDHHTQSPTQATTVQFDFLAILMTELDALGLNYSVAAQNMNADVEFPSTTDGSTFTDIRYSDSDVILVKDGISVSGVVERNFLPDFTAVIEIGGRDVAFTRGYSYLRATKDGVAFTFSNAHLEVGGPAVAAQIAQAGELSATLSGQSEPVLLVGDFNSNPADAGDDGQSYRNLTEDYTDAWVVVDGGDGFTCCQDPLLMNTTSELSTRIDLVLFRGDVEATSVSVVGNDPADMTGSGVWPSDHAGVVSTLTVRN